MDLLKHEVELRGAGSWGPFRAKGQKVTITQLQPVTPWESDIIDQSPLAAAVLQADPPVITLALGVQLRVDSRDQARLLLGPQGHITQVSPVAQTIGASRAAWGVEGVEITAPAASDAQQLKAGQHGRRPSAPPLPLQESITFPTAEPCTVAQVHFASDANFSYALCNFNFEHTP